MPPLEKLGPYRLDKLLGRGGMGAVYAGVNESTGERAAVKVLSPHLADNSDFRERFITEVETLKKLKHPNIVQLLAYGEEDDHLFYVMELVQGRSLQDEIQSGRRFTWREVAKIGVDISRALKHAHDSGVIHRDLKPANLLLDAQDQVKLTDFGIAKLFGNTQITSAGGILGTADYMAPEQAEGKPVTVRSDLYSLGSVMYALLAGRPPFASKSLAEVIHGLRFEKPTPVRRLAPDTPGEFESIIMQLLEKEPAKRIASAFAVGNFLRAMEHALSLETQVGHLKVDDLPSPSASVPQASPITQAGLGFDATLVTQSPKSSSGEAGMTVDIASPQAQDDYRLAEGAATAVSVVSPSVPRPKPVMDHEKEPSQPKSRFVTMEEEEAQRRRQRVDEEGLPLWLVAGGLALAVGLLGGVLWYALSPPTADTLYAKIAAAAESEEPEQLSNVSTEVRQFLERFPQDPRFAEVQQHQETLEMQRLERRFAIRARLGSAGALTPVQRAYFDAVRISATDPPQAIEQFQALVAVFGTPDDQASDEEERTRRISVELAKKQIQRIQESIAETSDEYREVLVRRLNHADELRKDAPQEAAAIYGGFVELYRNKPWATDLVNRAQEALSDLRK